MLQFQATILMAAEFTLPMVKADARARIWSMKKLLLALAIGAIAALALLARIRRRYFHSLLFFVSGCPGVPEAASHRLGSQERLGKM